MTILEHPTLMVALPITVRIATQTDLPKLEWYGQYAHHRNLFRRAFHEQQLGKRLMLVADSNHFPIGQVFIQFVKPRPDNNKRWGYLYSLRVMEMFQGHGIGSCLIQEAEHAIIERGLGWATIAVAKENQAARRLYERLGYEVFGEDSGKWHYTDHHGQVRQVQEPCWLMQKQLLE